MAEQTERRVLLRWVFASGASQSTVEAGAS